ncbi:MAG: MYG1 family protein [Patescibacteria group bacterium]
MNQNSPSFNKKNVVIGTHLGKFHADDVLAVATLRMLYPDAPIVRTRDLEKLKDCDIVVDVGLIYDPENGRYDHHQKDGAGKRTNGIEYSSFGLVWKDYGLAITDNEEIAKLVDEILVQSVDARDNGQSIMIKNPAFNGASNFCLSSILDTFNPTWDEPQDHDKAFEDALIMAEVVIKGVVRSCQSVVRAKKQVRQALAERQDSRILVLKQGCPWQNVVLLESEGADVLYVILPGEEGNWRVQAVPLAFGSFRNRKALPKAWGGLQSEALSELTSVPDAHFCHNKLFICSAVSREGAIKLAKLAIETD